MIRSACLATDTKVDVRCSVSTRAVVVVIMDVDDDDDFVVSEASTNDF